jgi:hypothetical protein
MAAVGCSFYLTITFISSELTTGFGTKNLNIEKGLSYDFFTLTTSGLAIAILYMPTSFEAPN